MVEKFLKYAVFLELFEMFLMIYFSDYFSMGSPSTSTAEQPPPAKKPNLEPVHKEKKEKKKKKDKKKHKKHKNKKKKSKNFEIDLGLNETSQQGLSSGSSTPSP